MFSIFLIIPLVVQIIPLGLFDFFLHSHVEVTTLEPIGDFFLVSSLKKNLSLVMLLLYTLFPFLFFWSRHHLFVFHQTQFSFIQYFTTNSRSNTKTFTRRKLFFSSLLQCMILFYSDVVNPYSYLQQITHRDIFPDLGIVVFGQIPTDILSSSYSLSLPFC